jgi:subtilisin family serine protease
VDTPLGQALGCSPHCLNAGSSAGGLAILFNLDGRRLPEPDLRQTPDVVGPDGGNTTFFSQDITLPPGLVPGEPDGFPNFFGTSASAPHVAAVAALLLDLAREKDVTAPPALIYDLLERTAQDFKAYGQGYDLDSGFGFVRAKKALKKAEKVFEKLEYDQEGVNRLR